jgi:hypothetical protein
VGAWVRGFEVAASWLSLRLQPPRAQQHSAAQLGPHRCTAMPLPLAGRGHAVLMPAPPLLYCFCVAEEIKQGGERWKESITPHTPEEAAIAAGELPDPPPSACCRNLA